MTRRGSDGGPSLSHFLWAGGGPGGGAGIAGHIRQQNLVSVLAGADAGGTAGGNRTHLASLEVLRC